MKSWMLGAAIAALALPAGAARAQQISLPPLVMPGAIDSGPQHFPLPERHDRPPHEAFLPEQAAAEAKAGATLPMWSGSVTDGVTGKTFKYMMVGQNPQILLSEPATTIKTVIVPVVFTFQSSNVVFDPTTVDAACSPAGSAVALTLQSPMFTNIADLMLPDGTDIGSGQYASLFQRGNFFEFTGPGGINPNFSLILKPKVEQSLAVPISGGAVRKAPCGQFGEIDINTWDAFVRKNVFPMLSSSLTPNTFPLFLFYNVVLFSGTPGNCCTLGYHSAFANPSHGGNLQTYAVSAYISDGAFKSEDISTLSHEINEWQDDPTAGNQTPFWGHLGQVQGCQKTLEVGDPLTGTSTPLTMGNGFTYHVQDLAFFSWFYHQTPSFGVEGLYSLFGTFTSPAFPCA